MKLKRLLLFTLLLYCSTILNAQEINEYDAADNLMIHIPSSASVSTKSISEFIQAHFTTEKEKFRAIYRWVTYNIKYDRDSMYAINYGADAVTKVTAAMRRRKGVCENYTAIFTEIALKCGLQCYIVDGYTKQSGAVNKTGHSWCAVKIKDEWFFADPTWDVNYIPSTNYFLISPGEFIHSHMPFDPLWQLMNSPITYREFNRSFVAQNKNSANHNFEDSVKAFLKLSEAGRLEAAARRMLRGGLQNDLIKIITTFL